MLDDEETLADLRRRLPPAGQVRWIGLRPSPRARVVPVPEALAVAGRGLDGDHRAVGPGGRRQVTLIQLEHLPVVAALAGLDAVAPEALRRNLVVGGVSLLALVDRQFEVGEAVLLGTGPCHPCSRMEQAVGPGGYNAMRGHGGITARVLSGGRIRIGDLVRVSPG